jgi:cytochrome c-type biogenesis protein CcsB
MTASLLLAYGAWACFGGAALGYLMRTNRLVKGASWLAAIGLGLLSGSLVSRGLEAGHWPLVGRYEFALCFAWSAVLVHMILEASLGARAIGTGGQPLAFLLMSYALIGVRASARTSRPLPPALQSIWLQIHVVSAALAYGAFAVAAGLGASYLLRRGRPAEDNPVPPDNLEGFAWRAVGIGFPLLSLSMLSGAIWAQDTWGNYWNWDPKETWALITWLVYLTYLHARGLRGWRGRGAAWLVVGAFGVVVFTFLGINWLVRQMQLESLHVF